MAAAKDPLVEEMHRGRLSTRLNRIINHLAGRDDLLLECVWDKEGLESSAPAWFNPRTKWVTVNGPVALRGADPATVNPLTMEGRRKVPVLMGLCAHEASHAHSTRWPEGWTARGIDVSTQTAMTMLEEVRIERRQIERRPTDRPYLRASASLVLPENFAADDTVPQLTRWRAAQAAVLTLGRLDAGVLEPEDVVHVEPVLRDRLGDDLDVLRGLWNEAAELDDGNFDGMAEVASRWVATLGDSPAEGLKMGGCGAEVTGERPPSNDEWADDTDTSDTSEHDPSADKDKGGENPLGFENDDEDEPPSDGGNGALKTAGGGGDSDSDKEGSEDDDAESEGDGDGGDSSADATPGDDSEGDSSEGSEGDGSEGDGSSDGSQSPNGNSSNGSGSDALSDAMRNMAESAETGGASELAVSGSLPSVDSGSERLQQVEQRQADEKRQAKAKADSGRTFDSNRTIGLGRRSPTTAERILARQIGDVLKHASFRERDMTKVRSDVPPGRLESREAMLGSAQRSLRLPVTARPFRDKRFKHTPELPVTLGIMADNSGSMSWAVDLMSTLSWCFAHALTYVKGRAASVVYADYRVTPLASAGQLPSQVSVFESGGGGEVFGKAFAALDGALNLTMGRGVRLLVVISDGQYETKEHRAAKEAVARMTRNGGIVLWVTHSIERSIIPDGAIPLEVAAENATDLLRGTLRRAMLASRLPSAHDDSSEFSESDPLPFGADVVPKAMTAALAVALRPTETKD